MLLPGWFSHISIFQGASALDPSAPAKSPSDDGGNKVTWTAIEGGKGVTVREKTYTFYPKTGLIWDNEQGFRRLAGWIDVEKLYEAANPKSK
jgi:hypothetical protein